MKYFEFTFRTHPCTEIVTDVLAAVLGEVGFESFVECEGGLTAYIQQTICDENAIKIAITAGIDMSMVPYEVSFCTWLKELVEEGEVSMSRIDDAVRRVLRLKYRLGLFENPYWNIEEYNKFGSS